MVPCRTVKEHFGLSVAMPKNGTLTIGERKGQFKGMLKDRTFVIVPVSQDNPKAFNRMRMDSRYIMTDANWQSIFRNRSCILLLKVRHQVNNCVPDVSCDTLKMRKVMFRYCFGILLIPFRIRSIISSITSAICLRNQREK